MCYGSVRANPGRDTPLDIPPPRAGRYRLHTRSPVLKVILVDDSTTRGLTHTGPVTRHRDRTMISSGTQHARFEDTA